MTPRISVIVPTRQRTHLLAPMLLSVMSTAQERVEIVMRVDVDDDESIAYLRMSPFPFPFIVGPRYNGYATLGMLINEAARMSRGELVLVVNDDVEFCTRGWDTKLLALAAQYPDGIFNIGVQVENADNFVFPCISRTLVHVLDGVFDERLVYPDIGLRDVLRAFNRAVRTEEVVIKHNWMGMTPDQQNAVGHTQTGTYHNLYALCVQEGIEKIKQHLRRSTCVVHSTDFGSTDFASVGVAK